MSGQYNMHIENASMILAIDDDGGESIVDFAESRGTDAATAIFREWITKEVAAQRIAKERAQAERFKRDATEARRRAFSIVAGRSGGVAFVAHDCRDVLGALRSNEGIAP